MTETIAFKCVRCGSPISVTKESEWPPMVQCGTCGQAYKMALQEDPPEFGWLELIGAALFGMIFLGWIPWTYVGREMAKAAIQRGAAVTKEKVEEWMKRGEEG